MIIKHISIVAVALVLCSGAQARNRHINLFRSNGGLIHAWRHAQHNNAKRKTGAAIWLKNLSHANHHHKASKHAPKIDWGKTLSKLGKIKHGKPSVHHRRSNNVTKRIGNPFKGHKSQSGKADSRPPLPNFGKVKNLRKLLEANHRRDRRHHNSALDFVTHPNRRAGSHSTVNPAQNFVGDPNKPGGSSGQTQDRQHYKSVLIGNIGKILQAQEALKKMKLQQGLARINKNKLLYDAARKAIADRANMQRVADGLARTKTLAVLGRAALAGRNGNPENPLLDHPCNSGLCRHPPSGGSTDSDGPQIPESSHGPVGWQGQGNRDGGFVREIINAAVSNATANGQYGGGAPATVVHVHGAAPSGEAHDQAAAPNETAEAETICTRPAQGTSDDGKHRVEWIDLGGWKDFELKPDLSTQAKTVSLASIFNSDCKIHGFDLVEETTKAKQVVTQTSHYNVEGDFLGYDITVKDGDRIVTTSFKPDGTVKGVNVVKASL